MKRLKKIIMSIGFFITGLISKVFAANEEMVEKDKLLLLNINQETKYGVSEPSGPKIAYIGTISLAVFFFLFGLMILIDKKLTKKKKAIALSVLVLLTILGYIILRFIVIKSNTIY